MKKSLKQVKKDNIEEVNKKNNNEKEQNNIEVNEKEQNNIEVNEKEQNNIEVNEKEDFNKITYREDEFCEREYVFFTLLKDVNDDFVIHLNNKALCNEFRGGKEDFLKRLKEKEKNCLICAPKEDLFSQNNSCIRKFINFSKTGVKKDLLILSSDLNTKISEGVTFEKGHIFTCPSDTCFDIYYKCGKEKISSEKVINNIICLSDKDFSLTENSFLRRNVTILAHGNIFLW